MVASRMKNRSPKNQSGPITLMRDHILGKGVVILTRVVMVTSLIVIGQGHIFQGKLLLQMTVVVIVDGEAPAQVIISGAGIYLKALQMVIRAVKVDLTGIVRIGHGDIRVMIDLGDIRVMIGLADIRIMIDRPDIRVMIGQTDFKVTIGSIDLKVMIDRREMTEGLIVVITRVTIIIGNHKMIFRNVILVGVTKTRIDHVVMKIKIDLPGISLAADLEMITPMN
jgi:hypothetical protein